MNKEYQKPELVLVRLEVMDLMTDVIGVSDLEWLPDEDELPLVPFG